MTSQRRQWGPSAPGKFFTRTESWTFSLSANSYQLRVAGMSLQGKVAELEQLRSSSGLFWATVAFSLPGREPILLDGIPNADASELLAAVQRAVRKVRVDELLQDFVQAVRPVVQWATSARGACRTQLASRGWLSHEFKEAQSSLKPRELEGLLSEPEVVRHLEAQEQSLKDAVSLWRRNFSDVADSINDRHLARVAQEHKEFFEQVEKSPLTEEQIEAVVCFDNRVLLVASAGSGKTSTMVAKAGYALKRGYFKPEQILLLAFNKDAAAELRERLMLRLIPQGLPADRVVAKTFHAFGLDVIGAATGKRPTLATWLDSGQDLEVLLELIDRLKDTDVSFRTQWDLFRVVFGQDLPTFGKEHEAPDAWDGERKVEGFWTLNGEVVKSRGEQIIANWLFYNGIQYHYEAPYQVDTADALHRQYRPDFYLPDVNAYLEHWAIDQNGEPPREFEGYKEGMTWKREIHAENGTTLLETTMADLWSGKAFTYLEEELAQRGIALDPNPDRPAIGRRPIENPRLARTFRAFLTHAKSNRLSMKVLRQRLEGGEAGDFRFRHQMFLGLFEKVWTAWEERLEREGVIDFEDMLGLAADCIEAGRWKSPYELVMVDEFQDVSQARARLVASLLNAPGRHLFAVGDDWQSINRFAGSDLAVMTDFEAKFGKAVTLRLEKTFRCPQSLCDISSAFVQKNPRQLRKRVKSAKTNIERPIRILRVDDLTKIQAAVAATIHALASAHPKSDKPLNIYVLGRYRDDSKYLPVGLTNGRVQVAFVTAHSSKGLEADHVIVPRMTSESLGFPSKVEDDPVLQLAMPDGDAFIDAEERRLFYVALTRAKATVTLITLAQKESAFIIELVKDHQIEVRDLDGGVDRSRVCPACGEGFMVQRAGPYGAFLGCSRFPRCSHKEKLPPHAQSGAHGRRGSSQNYQSSKRR